MSDTPKTDARVEERYGNLKALQGIEVVDADFARQLERELAAYKAKMPEEPAWWWDTNCIPRLAVVHKTDYDALAKRCARLTVELEAARKDAERYRWLRIGDNPQVDLMDKHYGVELDEAIDAAIARGKA